MILKNIDEKCEERGLSRSALEKKLELSNGSISKWRKHKPSSDSLMKVAKALDCTMEELMKE